MTRRVVSSSVTDADRFQLKSYVIGTTAAPGVARLDPRALRTICALATSTTQRTHDEIKICWLNLVGACLVCGLVVCAVWLRCPCHVLGWVEHWGTLGPLQGWWVRRGFPIDTECTAVRDYGFPVGLGNPAWSLFCHVWLWGVAGVVWPRCSCGLPAEQVLSPAGWLAEGTVNLLMSPTVLAWSGQCDLTGSVVMWVGVVALFAIPAMTYCSWA